MNNVTADIVNVVKQNPSYDDHRKVKSLTVLRPLTKVLGHWGEPEG